jgi:membrane-associated phospholipid phosphatase
VVTILKILTDRARPFRLLAQTRVVGSRAAGLSFPSGHTTQAFFTMTLLLRHLQGSLVAAVGLYGLAALVAYARVYLGVHYPRDVIAGAILGLLWGALSFLIVSQL